MGFHIIEILECGLVAVFYVVESCDYRFKGYSRMCDIYYSLSAAMVDYPMAQLPHNIWDYDEQN